MISHMNIGQFGEAFIPIYDGVGRVMKAYADTMAKRGHDVYMLLLLCMMLALEANIHTK